MTHTTIDRLPAGEPGWEGDPGSHVRQALESVSVSVVIPARNAAERIGRQLRALATQNYDGWWEVIVADNGSTDDTLQRVREMEGKIPRLRIVDASQRRGASHARNVGADAAKGELLLFVDADDRVGETWLREMAQAAETADAITGRVRAYFVRSDETEVLENESDCLEPVFEFWPSAPAGNFGIWAEVFDEIGGFNEEYRVCEGVEIAWRLRAAGHTVRFVWEGVLDSYERRTGRGIVRQSYTSGQGYPHLYRDFRGLGMPRYGVVRTLRYSVRRYVRDAWKLLRTERGRREWLRGVAWRVGCLVGSIRYRVVCP